TTAYTCSDGVKNGAETAVDCGGSACAACAPTCTDGVKNGTETGVDCGGSCAACAPTCTDGVMNGTEPGIDCGGSCPACSSGTCTAATTNTTYSVDSVGTCFSFTAGGPNGQVLSIGNATVSNALTVQFYGGDNENASGTQCGAPKIDNVAADQLNNFAV